MRTGSTIVGLGRYLPERILTNAELARAVDTTDEWIRSRTGVAERRIAAPAEASSDLAYGAAREAMEAAGIGPSEIDLIVVGTTTPDMVFPNVACLLQKRLGTRTVGCLDVSAACSSFVYGLSVAHGAIASGQAETVLVVGAETLSRITNWRDRATCVLFGDCAGAAVLRPARRGSGFLSFCLGGDGQGETALYLKAGGSGQPASYETVERGEHYISMNGPEVYQFAVRAITDAAAQALREADLGPADVDFVIPHQANIRIIESAARRLRIPLDKFFVNVQRYGNTSAASIPVALYEAVEAGHVGDGRVGVLVTFGAGYTWAACAIRWGGGQERR
ncbi:MAG TPA: beta-ketoacyl-ACP synthase III [bacterium]|nr:beta-ketoacyl-ACP synthase III [bacterium]